MGKKSVNIILIIVNGLLYLTTIGLWLAVTDETILNFSVSIFSLLLTILLLILNRKKFHHFYTSKYFGQFSSYLFTLFLIFFILGLINFITYKNPFSMDISPHKINSLTEKSKSIVKKAGKLKITVFAPASSFRQFDAFLELYRLENRLLKIEMVDAEADPLSVKKYGITKIPTFHFSSGEKQKSITELSELSISNAIHQVSTGKIPEIYLTKGHGEIDFDNTANEGASVLFRQIRNSNVKSSVVNLSELKEIPRNVKALIIWGPQSSFFETEIKLIDDYLKKDGKLMLAIDPQLNTDNNTLLRKWLAESWGISLDNNVVIDRLKHIKGSKGTVPMVAQFDKKHPISKDINNVVFFPVTSAVGLTEKDTEKNKNFTIIASSMPFPAAWAEYDLGEIFTQNPKYNEGTDVEGPVGYVGALEYGKNRLLVYGNSTFVNNTYQKFPKNAGFFLNGLSWLLGRDDSISLDSPVVEEKPVFINQHQIGLILYFTVLFLPIVLIGLATFFYFKKRTS